MHRVDSPFGDNRQIFVNLVIYRCFNFLGKKYATIDSHQWVKSKSSTYKRQLHIRTSFVFFSFYCTQLKPHKFVFSLRSVEFCWIKIQFYLWNKWILFTDFSWISKNHFSLHTHTVPISADASLLTFFSRNYGNISFYSLHLILDRANRFIIMNVFYNNNNKWNYIMKIVCLQNL